MNITSDSFIHKSKLAPNRMQFVLKLKSSVHTETFQEHDCVLMFRFVNMTKMFNQVLPINILTLIDCR
jgi:hypothetical protein